MKVKLSQTHAKSKPELWGWYWKRKLYFTPPPKLQELCVTKSISWLSSYFCLSKCRGKLGSVPTLPPACSGSRAAEQHACCQLKPCLQMPWAWVQDLAMASRVPHPPAGRNPAFATLFSSSPVVREKRRGAGAPGFAHPFPLWAVGTGIGMCNL